jgi:hypothetical protein
MEETRIRDYHSFRTIGGIARDERIQDFNRIITSRIDIDELAEEKMKTLSKKIKITLSKAIKVK